jgi:hypothetical protein
LSVHRNKFVDLQQGHLLAIATQWYNCMLAVPHGFTVAVLKGFWQNSYWWQYITGTLFVDHSVIVVSSAM